MFVCVHPGEAFVSKPLARALVALGGVLAATIGFAVPAAGAVPSAVLFVAPGGDDANSGTDVFHPVRTPQRAQELVRARNQTMTGDIDVLLLPGTYRLAAPLRLDASDSGTNGHTVRWTGVPGATVLSGDTRLSGWQRTAPDSPVWSAPAPADLRTRQLYVDGVRAQRASGPLPVKVTTIAKGYTTDAPTMDNWRNPKDIEFVYDAGLGGWTEPRCPVAAISPTEITMAQPCWDNTN